MVQIPLRMSKVPPSVVLELTKNKVVWGGFVTGLAWVGEEKRSAFGEQKRAMQHHPPFQVYKDDDDGISIPPEVLYNK